MAASELHSNLGCTLNSRNEFRSSIVGTRSDHRPVLIVICCRIRKVSAVMCGATISMMENLGAIFIL